MTVRGSAWHGMHDGDLEEARRRVAARAEAARLKLREVERPAPLESPPPVARHDRHADQSRLFFRTGDRD